MPRTHKDGKLDGRAHLCISARANARMAFDHPGISSGEDPRGESDKDRSGLSWIAEYVFEPEYVFGHINEYFQDNGRIWTWMSFQASQPLIQNPKPRLERIPCQPPSRPRQPENMPRVASLRPPSRPLDGSWIFRMKPPTAPPHTELGSSRPSREMTVDSHLHEPSI